MDKKDDEILILCSWTDLGAAVNSVLFDVIKWFFNGFPMVATQQGALRVLKYREPLPPKYFSKDCFQNSVKG